MQMFCPLRHLLPFALIIVLSLAAPAIGQTPLASPTTQNEEPRKTGVTEEVHVRLVEVSVTARDHKGQPVTDLTVDDLEIKVRGRKMRLAFAERVYDEKPAAEALPEVRLHVEAPGTIESIATTHQRPPHYFIFMIDVENDDKLLRPRAMHDIARFITTRMREEDYGAVISFNGKIHVEVGFTRERGVLTEAVAHGYSQPARPGITKRRQIEQLIDTLDDCVARVKDAIKTADESCVQRLARAYTAEKTPSARNFLEALDGIVRYAGGLHGRASVFAISHGKAVNPTLEFYQAVRSVFGDTVQIARLQSDLTFGEGAHDELDDLVQLALREGVTFYFIDRSSSPPGMAGARQQGFYKPGVDPVVAAYRQPQADIGEITGATGGEFILNKSAYKGLERAMDGELGRYNVGFYVDELLSAKDLRRIRIKVRRRGVRLRSGRGSYSQEHLRDTGIGELRFGKTSVLEGERKGRFIPFKLTARPRLFGYERAGEAMAGQLTLHFIVQTQNGTELTESYHFFSHSYPLRLWEVGKEEAITIDGWLEAPDGTYRLIAQIRNPKTGQGGQIVREIKVVTP